MAKHNIPIKTDLDDQQGIRINEVSIELTKDRLIYIVDVVSDRELNNDTGMWEENTKTYVKATVARDMICGVEMTRLTSSWKVQVIFRQPDIYYKWYLAKKSQAEELYNIIYNYVFEKQLKP